MKTNIFGNLPTDSKCHYSDWRCFVTGIGICSVNSYTLIFVASYFNSKLGGPSTQNVMLSTVTLVSLHFHNYIARELYKINGHWSDEKLFQEARRISIAIYQHIIYKEWLPLLVGIQKSFSETYLSIKFK